MGGGSSAEASEKTKSIDQDLQMVKAEMKKAFTFKILLLGAGESGKSTVLKQLKTLHKKKLKAEEKKIVGTSLHQNTIDCFKSILTAVKTFGMELDEKFRETEAWVQSHPENQRLTPEQGAQLLALFNCEQVQAAYARRNEFWLLDSFPYYLANLERFCQDGFEPNYEDYVMARVRTTGVVETKLESKIEKKSADDPDSLRFVVVDVGGQRNERRKWINCFSEVSAVLFLVNLAGYNQVMFEDTTRNRLEEELELFKKVSAEKVFVNTPIFLFLNKKDLFETMIRERDLSTVFKDYTGGGDIQNSMSHLQAEFKKQLPKNKTVHIEELAARQGSEIGEAFERVKAMLWAANQAAAKENIAKYKARQEALLQQRLKAQQTCCGPAPQPYKEEAKAPEDDDDD